MAKKLYTAKDYTEKEFEKLLKIEDLEEKMKAVERYRSTANSRIFRLAKADMLKISQPYKDIFRTTEKLYFQKAKTEKELNKLIANLSHFLTSKRTTKADLKGYLDKVEIARERLNKKFKKKGKNIEIKTADELFQFFDSDVYKNTRKYANSEELVEKFYEEYYDTQTNWDEIIKQFEDFTNTKYSEAEEEYKKRKAERERKRKEKWLKEKAKRGETDVY